MTAPCPPTKKIRVVRLTALGDRRRARRHRPAAPLPDLERQALRTAFGSPAHARCVARSCRGDSDGAQLRRGGFASSPPMARPVPRECDHARDRCAARLPREFPINSPRRDAVDGAWTRRVAVARDGCGRYRLYELADAMETVAGFSQSALRSRREWPAPVAIVRRARPFGGSSRSPTSRGAVCALLRLASLPTARGSNASARRAGLTVPVVLMYCDPERQPRVRQRCRPLFSGLAIPNSAASPRPRTAEFLA